MAISEENIKSKITYWKVFRLVFVLFSFYLMKDVFYRWDGFRYHSTLLDFLPSVALVTVLWTVVAIFAALMIWLILWTVEWFFEYVNWKIRADHLILFLGGFIMIIAMVWAGKRMIWPDTAMPNIVKFMIMAGSVFASVSFTWTFRNTPDMFNERITPLVWLFGIIFVLSLSTVVYQTWLRQTGSGTLHAVSQNFAGVQNRPNIILITFDALTARDMSLYGYEKQTTPYVNKWSKEASVFTFAEAESNWTRPSVASLMTGKRVWTHRNYHLFGPGLKNSTQNFPLMLKKNGFYNMAFVVNDIASAQSLGISDSFDIAPVKSDFIRLVSLYSIVNNGISLMFGENIRMHEWISKGNFIFGRLLYRLSRDFSETESPPEIVFNNVLKVFQDKPPEPYFAWIHVLPPHDPYLPPEPYVGMFDSSSKFRSVKEEFRFMWPGFTEYEQAQQPDINILRARYDEFIRYCDKEFEKFIVKLKKVNNPANTVFILSADHGESFEHGYIRHSGKHMYEQVTHIPLIIKEPGQTKGTIIDDLVEQIDIPPTVLDLAGIPVPSWMEGRSLVSLLRGKNLPSKTAFSMNIEKNPVRGKQKITKGTIAVWEEEYKLIHYLEEGESLLYDLKKDPGELDNLFNKEPETGQRLLSLVQNNLQRANEKILLDN